MGEIQYLNLRISFCYKTGLVTHFHPIVFFPERKIHQSPSLVSLKGLYLIFYCLSPVWVFMCNSERGGFIMLKDVIDKMELVVGVSIQAKIIRERIFHARRC